MGWRKIFHKNIIHTFYNRLITKHRLKPTNLPTILTFISCFPVACGRCICCCACALHGFTFLRGSCKHALLKHPTRCRIINSKYSGYECKWTWMVLLGSSKLRHRKLIRHCWCLKYLVTESCEYFVLLVRDKLECWLTLFIMKRGVRVNVAFGELGSEEGSGGLKGNKTKVIFDLVLQLQNLKKMWLGNYLHNVAHIESFIRFRFFWIIRKFLTAGFRRRA